LSQQNGSQNPTPLQSKLDICRCFKEQLQAHKTPFQKLKYHILRNIKLKVKSDALENINALNMFGVTGHWKSNLLTLK
jgi:hypothetical protein